MKEEILKRAMFAMPLSKEAQGTGIMSGFDMEEMEDQDENADMEEMPPMARTPQNPEILMNNLRGDMRSVDARYMELAQMVGEEAAMETPPEVLAMLMGQMGAQQGGIGALPQGQEMMPPGAQAPGAQAPGAGMPAPDQMGAPQPAPAMPQGGIPMPEGMESAPPFSQGAEAPQGFAYGGEVARPTPDGMPPMYAAAGAFINPAMRAAQFVGDKASQYGSAANAALGRMFMTPQGISQPYLENVRGPGGRFMAEQVQRGGDLLQPTFTQGLQQGVARFADQYPRVAQTGAAALSALGVSAIPRGGQDQGSSLMDQIPRDTREELVAAGQRPIDVRMDMNTMTQQRPGQPATPIPVAAPADQAPAPSSAAGALRDMTAAFPGDFGAEREAPATKEQGKDVAEFIKEAEKPKAKTKIERIKEAQGEYNTMFSEILGDDKESAKINALLLLSEAGLKLASTRKPTFAMALADAASGLPRGMAAIAAQERELSIKGKSAALQQAITDVTAQDAAAAARQNMIAEYALKGEIERMKNQGVIFKDGGAGMLIGENKAGSRVGTYLDPSYVESVKQNPIAISFNEQEATPFVRDLGPANTVVAKDPKQRAKIEEDMNIIAGQLATVRGMKDVVGNAYSPGTFFTGVKNQYFVPLLPDAIVSPDVNKAQVVSVLKNGFSDLARGRASQDGRLSVQQEKWQRENDEPIAKPDGLLQNPELAAKVLQTKETALLNEWYNSATKLGVFDRNRVMDTPPTGTKNDPFVIPSDAQGQAQMMNFLRTNFGSVQDPRAMIHVRKPNGERVSLSIQNLLNPTER
jgi:hypothetical protein